MRCPMGACKAGMFRRTGGTGVVGLVDSAREKNKARAVITLPTSSKAISRHNPVLAITVGDALALHRDTSEDLALGRAFNWSANENVARDVTVTLEHVNADLPYSFETGALPPASTPLIPLRRLGIVRSTTELLTPAAARPTLALRRSRPITRPRLGRWALSTTAGRTSVAARRALCSPTCALFYQSPASALGSPASSRAELGSSSRQLQRRVQWCPSASGAATAWIRRAA